MYTHRQTDIHTNTWHAHFVNSFSDLRTSRSAAETGGSRHRDMQKDQFSETDRETDMGEKPIEALRSHGVWTYPKNDDKDFIILIHFYT